MPSTFTFEARRILSALGSASLDLLMPPRCLACEEPVDRHGAFCPVCDVALTPVAEPCARCGLPDAAPLCPACVRSPPAFASAHAPWLYGGSLSTVITRMKYGDHPELARPLGRFLAATLRAADLAHHALVPVPLHHRQLARRGFNQAALLARHARSGLPHPILHDALRRTRPTAEQAGLSRADRLTNRTGAFVVPRPSLVRGRKLLLVDDVLTTGATAQACAVALYDAGALEVRVLTVARAVP
ncbi:MAG: ComF family protein [Deltaproteobacteria bacterium]|nr:ComF family protein [Deltaproteobacteria bacterium]